MLKGQDTKVSVPLLVRAAASPAAEPQNLGLGLLQRTQHYLVSRLHRLKAALMWKRTISARVLGLKLGADSASVTVAHAKRGQDLYTLREVFRGRDPSPPQEPSAGGVSRVTPPPPFGLHRRQRLV